MTMMMMMMMMMVIHPMHAMTVTSHAPFVSQRHEQEWAGNFSMLNRHEADGVAINFTVNMDTNLSVASWVFAHDNSGKACVVQTQTDML